MEALAPVAYGYLLVLFRAAALCAVAPVLGAHAVPARVRLALAMALAMAAYASASFAAPPPPDTLGALAAAAGRETALGLAAGVSAKFFFDAALAVGQLAGNAMGLGYGALIDQMSGAESTVLGDLLSALALGAIVTLGLHREALLWLCRSLQELPAGSAVPLGELVARAVGDAVRAVSLMARLGFPFLAAATVGHVALGLLSRAAPQLSLQSLGFTIAICAGGGAVYLLAPSAAELIAREALQVLTRNAHG